MLNKWFSGSAIFEKIKIYIGNFQVESPTLYSKVCLFILKVKPFSIYCNVSVCMSFVFLIQFIYIYIYI